MNTMSLKTKLIVSFGIIAAIIIGIGGYAFFSFESFNNKTSEITTNWMKGISLGTKMRKLNAEYKLSALRHMISNTPELKEKYRHQMEDVAAQIEKNFEDYQQMINEAVYDTEAAKNADQASLDKARAQWKVLGGLRSEFLQESNASMVPTDSLKSLMKNKIEPAFDAMENEAIGPLIEAQRNGAEQVSAEAAEMFEQAHWILGLILLAAVLLSVGIAGALSRNILAAVNNLMRISEKVKDGDLRDKAPVLSNDELGMLTESYNQMIENVRRLVTEIQKSSVQVASASEELTSSAEQSALVTETIAKDIMDVAASSSEQVHSVDIATQVLERVTSSVENTSATIDIAADKSRVAVEMANTGHVAVERAVQQMDSIEKTVNMSAEVVAKLGERSQQIGQIVDTISAIAGQTNLLALNAAIEAARAGEHGKGFAVVAEEVRKLAEQSQEAAKQIAELITNVQVETDQAVEAMKHGTGEVRVGADVVKQAGSAFVKIQATVKDIANQAGDVALTMDSLAKEAEHIVRAVEDIDKMSKNVASEAESVSAATEEQSASMEEIASSSRGLSDLAQKLQNIVAKFHI